MDSRGSVGLRTDGTTLDQWRTFLLVMDRRRRSIDALAEWADAQGVPEDANLYEEILAGRLAPTPEYERLTDDLDRAQEDYERFCAPLIREEVEDG